jgi:hypothetical protein
MDVVGTWLVWVWDMVVWVVVLVDHGDDRGLVMDMVWILGYTLVLGFGVYTVVIRLLK